MCLECIILDIFRAATVIIFFLTLLILLKPSMVTVSETEKQNSRAEKKPGDHLIQPPV